jgi:hypothetical protein
LIISLHPYSEVAVVMLIYSRFNVGDGGFGS